MDGVRKHNISEASRARNKEIIAKFNASRRKRSDSDSDYESNGYCHCVF